MMVGQPGFFDLSDRYAALSAAGDPLERLASVVDFEVFRGQKHRMGLCVCTIGIARARIKIYMANFAYNLQRLARLE
jgi:hypothetical protein